MFYSPNNWYWIGNPNESATTIIYSSLKKAIVESDDTDYTLWRGPIERPINSPTPWPKDENGVVTYAALDEVLVAIGLPPTGLAKGV